jgi:hypothetical protein
MAIIEGDGQSRGRRRYRKWVTVAAIVVGSLGAAASALLAGGTPLVSSPMATAGTTFATPWVPRPIFRPAPVPKPKSSVSTQGGASPAQLKLNTWVSKANPQFTAIQTAMGDLGTALNTGNESGMKRACLAIDAATSKLADTLPSPQQDITDETQAVVDELNAMQPACMANPPDTEGTLTHATAANTHTGNVVKLVNS